MKLVALDVSMKCSANNPKSFELDKRKEECRCLLSLSHRWSKLFVSGEFEPTLLSPHGVLLLWGCGDKGDLLSHPTVAAEHSVEHRVLDSRVVASLPKYQIVGLPPTQAF